MKTNASRPFGSYFRDALSGDLLKRVEQSYDALLAAKTFADLSQHAIQLGNIFDENIADLRAMVGGGDSKFSYFRGSFLEELTILVAESVVSEMAPTLGVEVIKLGTGQGIIAGVSLAVSRDHLPEKIRISLRRDREDVTIGFRRTLVLYDSNSTDDHPSAVAQFPDEIIPVVIIACKMYIDATRLENVIAKARNLSDQHARCTYLVVAEWDALGKDWHDERGRVVDSHYAPISRIIFLRGDEARRPAGKKRQAGHSKYPYIPAKLMEVRDAVQVGLTAWMKKA